METSHVGLRVLHFVSPSACISLLMKAQFTLRKTCEICSSFLVGAESKPSNLLAYTMLY